MKRDDRDWMAILDQGQDFRAFVDEFKHQVFGLAYNLTSNHHDAEDLSQEVFISCPPIDRGVQRRCETVVLALPNRRQPQHRQGEKEKSRRPSTAIAS